MQVDARYPAINPLDFSQTTWNERQDFYLLSQIYQNKPLDVTKLALRGLSTCNNRYRYVLGQSPYLLYLLTSTGWKKSQDVQLLDLVKNVVFTDWAAVGRVLNQTEEACEERYCFLKVVGRNASNLFEEAANYPGYNEPSVSTFATSHSSRDSSLAQNPNLYPMPPMNVFHALDSMPMSAAALSVNLFLREGDEMLLDADDAQAQPVEPFVDPIALYLVQDPPAPGPASIQTLPKRGVGVVRAARKTSGMLKELAALADYAAAPLREKRVVTTANPAAAPLKDKKVVPPKRTRGPGMLRELAALADCAVAPLREKRVVLPAPLSEKKVVPPADHAAAPLIRQAVDAANKKIPWTPEEDRQLRRIVAGKTAQPIGWQQVADELREVQIKGVFRSRTACFARYKLLQTPKYKAAAAFKAAKKFPDWSPEEDERLLGLIQERIKEPRIRWSKVAAELSTSVVRTERACNSHFRLLQQSDKHDALWAKFPKLKTL